MLLIHARNVTGLGSSQVVSSLTRAVLRKSSMEMKFILPHRGGFCLLDDAKVKCIDVKSMLPNGLFRLVECLFPKLFYPSCEKTLVLGDVPLRGMKHQVVLMHQPNLVKPSVNPYSSRSMSFRAMRWIFAYNLKDVHWLVVQSGVMKDELILSYPVLQGRIKVMPQPAPDLFDKVRVKAVNSPKKGLTFFYPAAGYPHKNHVFIQMLAKDGVLSKHVKEVIVTLRDGEIQNLNVQDSVIKNVGRLSPQACMDYYSVVDALFFPSVAESYGLPLVEAMMVGLPILCADLPYARWMCENEAIYFDPENTNSADLAIQELNKRLSDGWKPDWSKALAKLPESWDDVAQEFLELLQ